MSIEKMSSFGSLLQKYATWFAIGGLLLICLIVFHQPLFSGEIVNASDILTQQYFWNIFTKDNLVKDPCFRTWLPYINGGSPAGGGLDLIFRPVSLLTLLLLPVHLAINYEMVIYFFLLGVCMYFYMKELGVSALNAFLAALFLMLNGEIVTLINAGHVNKIGAIALIPLVFWALERALKRKTLGAFLLTGAVLGIQFWQGHVQISFYLCIAVGIYYLVRIGLLYRQERNTKQLAKLLVYALVMVLVFLALSAVEFLPLLSFAQVSERAEGVSYEFATNWSMPPEEIITYLIPGFFGLRRLNYDDDEPRLLPYWGRMPFTQAGRYFGILPFLFVILGLCFVRNKHVLTLSILAGIVLLLGMGKYIPTYKFLYDYVPGFNKFRVPQMILFLFAFATSGLAGFGSEWLFADLSETKEKRLRIFLVVLVTICLLSWIIAIWLPQLKDVVITYFHEAFSRKEGTPEIAATRFQNIVSGLLLFNIMLSLAVFIFGLRLGKTIRIRWVVAALILVFIVDIWIFNAHYIDTVPLEGSIYIKENDAIRYCLKNPGLYRILPMTDTPDEYSTFNKYVYYKLFSVAGYEAVGVQYYNEYLRNMALGSRLIDLLNIKYIILPKGVTFDNTPVAVGKTVGPYKVVMDADAVLLENPNYLPRVFPVHYLYVPKKPEEILPTLSHPAFNLREVVILEEYPNVQLSPENIPSNQSTATITYYFNRTIQVKATMATEGFLVLSEKYDPGWKAYVNGRPTRIYKANYTFQALYLPKGEHVVTFAYQPTQFILGFGLTTITGLLLLGVWLYKRKPREQVLAKIHQKTDRFLQKIRPVYYSDRLLWGIIGLGILLHTAQYLFNRSLHVDEASLGLNIIERSFAELWQPLSSHQGAPIGFLMITKFLVQLFGTSEYVLRFFPFISAILAIFLFARFVPDYLPRSVVPVALGFFVLSEQLIVFSSTVKQYSSDVFFAVLLYAVMGQLQSQKLTITRIAAVSLIGALAVWCSHPVVFVLAGIGTTIAVLCIVRKEWAKLEQLVIVYACWLLSFLGTYMVSLRQLGQDEYLANFWKGAFFKIPPAFEDIKGLWDLFVDFVGYTIGFSQAIFDRLQSHSLTKLFEVLSQMITSTGEPFSPDMLGFFFFGIVWIVLYLLATVTVMIGCLSLLFRDKPKFFLLTAPVFFMLLASAFQKFPLGLRLLLFLVPSVIVLLGEGIARIREYTRQRLPVFGLALISVLGAYPILSASAHLFNPRTDQELRPIVQYVKDHEQPGDTLYLYYAAQGVFDYYAQRFHFHERRDYIVGAFSREDWNKYIQDLNQLRGKKRVWLIFSHVFGYEELFFRQYLDRIGGKQLDEFKRPKAAVYLYDLSGTGGK
jgi:hypothetical protein